MAFARSAQRRPIAMLFNSYQFAFGFLPIVLAIFLDPLSPRRAPHLRRLSDPRVTLLLRLITSAMT